METDALTKEATRVCLDCGGPIGPGRADKKFCSPACKTNYNNVLKAQEKPVKTIVTEDVPAYVLEVEKILRKNRLILSNVCAGFGKGSISVEELEGRGFNPDFFTSEAEPTSKGEIYRFCFEFGYRITKDKKTAVVVARKAVIEELN